MSPISTLTPISLMFNALSRKSIIVITEGASLIRENDIRGFFQAMDLCSFRGIEGIYVDGTVPQDVQDIAFDAALCRNLPILDTIPERYQYKPKAA